MLQGVGRIDEFRKWQFSVGAGLAFLAGERGASKVTRAKYGMPVWQIYAVSAATSLGTLSAMDEFYKLRSEQEHAAFREYHSMIFNLPAPIDFLPNPIGLVEAGFKTGMMIGEAYNPVEVARNNPNLLVRLINKYVSGPIESNPYINRKARREFYGKDGFVSR